MPKTVFIGLGSNLNNPVAQVNAALAALNHLPQTQLSKHSALYWSPSLLQGQPRYCNAVAMIITELTPDQLLTQLQTLETNQGRIHAEKWGERVIDLDILLFDDQIVLASHLTIPHVELLNRNFWLYPLYTIAPDLTLPVINQSLKDFIQAVDSADLELI